MIGQDAAIIGKILRRSDETLTATTEMSDLRRLALTKVIEAAENRPARVWAFRRQAPVLDGGMKNRRSWAWLLVIPFGLPLALSVTTGCTRAGGASAADPKTDDDKALYAWGLMLGRNASALAPSPAELELIKAGLTDSVQKNKPKVDIDKYGPDDRRGRAQARQRAGGGREGQDGEHSSRPPPRRRGAVKLPSGMVIKTTRPGTGAQPEAADRVKVHYEGRLSDGVGVRQLDQARRAGRLPPRRRHQVLDRGRRAHEGRREGDADLPVRSRRTATRGGRP